MENYGVIVGVEASEGVYEGHTYSNVIVYATRQIEPTKGVGSALVKYTVKKALFENTPYKDLLGKTVTDINYDKYRKVKSILIK